MHYFFSERDVRNFPYPTISKAFLYSNALKAISHSQASPFKDRNRQRKNKRRTFSLPADVEEPAPPYFAL